MANVDIKLGYKDSAWFTANAAIILKIGQIVYLEQTGTYKIGDGVTALSALSFLGGGGTQNLQQVINESPTVDGVVFQSLDGNTKAEISDSEINFTGAIKKNSEEIAVIESLVTVNITAENDKSYSLVTSSIFTDPTPVAGKGYTVILNTLQTATIGGVAYGGPNGHIIKRYYTGSAWVTRSFYSNTANLGIYAQIASPTFTGTVTTPAIIVSSETASTIASFDGSKNIKSLSTGTYPDLTELAYVKGVTSAIQTQLDAKLTKSRTLVFSHTTVNPADGASGFFGGNIVGATSSGATSTSRRAYAPCTGFVYAALIELYISSVLGTSETATVKVNNLTAGTTTTITTTLTYTTIASGTSIELGTPFAVTAADALEIEVNYPTWATNPTGVIHVVTLEIGAK